MAFSWDNVGAEFTITPEVDSAQGVLVDCDPPNHSLAYSALTVDKVSSGKWYWEFTVRRCDSGAAVGWSDATVVPNYHYLIALYIPSGLVIGSTNNSGGLDYGQYASTGTVYIGDIIQVALNLDTGNLWFGKDGTWHNSGNPATGVNPTFTGVSGSVGPAMYVKGGDAGIRSRIEPVSWVYTPPTAFVGLNEEPSTDTLGDGQIIAPLPEVVATGSDEVTKGRVASLRSVINGVGFVTISASGHFTAPRAASAGSALVTIFSDGTVKAPGSTMWGKVGETGKIIAPRIGLYGVAANMLMGAGTVTSPVLSMQAFARASLIVNGFLRTPLAQVSGTTVSADPGQDSVDAAVVVRRPRISGEALQTLMAQGDISFGCPSIHGSTTGAPGDLQPIIYDRSWRCRL